MPCVSLASPAGDPRASPEACAETGLASSCWGNPGKPSWGGRMVGRGLGLGKPHTRCLWLWVRRREWFSVGAGGRTDPSSPVTHRPPHSGLSPAALRRQVGSWGRHPLAPGRCRCPPWPRGHEEPVCLQAHRDRGGSETVAPSLRAEEVQAQEGGGSPRRQGCHPRAPGRAISVPRPACCLVPLESHSAPWSLLFIVQ